MFFWLSVFAVGLVFSVVVIVLMAAVPSTESASNKDVLIAVALCFAVALGLSVMVRDLASFLGGWLL